MIKRPILHVDMDGVVADFKKAVALIDPTLDIGDHPYEYARREKELEDLCAKNPNIFHDLEPIDGAIDGVSKLAEMYDIFFLSTPMWSLPESYTGKRIWIERHFPIIGVKKLILTHFKNQILGDYLIDDRLKNGASGYSGEHVHFGSEKFPNWEHVVGYLMTRN
jgi:5'(3')-deoxyribonucleotidase